MPSWARWALVAAWVAFIWSRSLFAGPESTEQSDFVVGLLRPLLEGAGVTDVSMMSFIVRKVAHFSEYLVLGVLLPSTRDGGVPWQQLFFGLAVPVADETIQMLIPGRSSQLTDVLIDFSGMLAGLLLGALVRSIKKRR